jgi:hypothetical protein
MRPLEEEAQPAFLSADAVEHDAYPPGDIYRADTRTGREHRLKWLRGLATR